MHLFSIDTKETDKIEDSCYYCIYCEKVYTLMLDSEGNDRKILIATNCEHLSNESGKCFSDCMYREE